MKEERSYTQRGDLGFWNYRHSDSCIMIIPSKQMTGSDSILKGSNLQEKIELKRRLEMGNTHVIEIETLRRKSSTIYTFAIPMLYCSP